MEETRKLTLEVRLRRALGYCGASALLMLMLPGCSSKSADATTGTQTTGATAGDTTAPSASAGGGNSASSANASDADMRKSFSQKSFDINSVPPAQRDHVRAMMQQNAGSGPSAPGATQK